MLYIQFGIDDDRYLLATDQVMTLIPFVEMHPAPTATDQFPGCINFKGEWVPVIDVVQLLGGRPALPRLSTRIIIFVLAGPKKAHNKVGLLVEKVTELVKLDETRFSTMTSQIRETPGLDALINDESGVLYRVQAEKLLCGHVSGALICDGLQQ